MFLEFLLKRNIHVTRCMWNIRARKFLFFNKNSKNIILHKPTHTNSKVLNLNRNYLNTFFLQNKYSKPSKIYGITPTVRSNFLKGRVNQSYNYYTNIFLKKIKKESKSRDKLFINNLNIFILFYLVKINYF
jgi:hypothetical protein